MKTNKGFTLIELITVIVLLGTLAGVLSGVMGQFAKIFSDTETRSELTSQARLAMERMSREIRRSIPFGIFVSSDETRLEFVSAKDGGRYIEKGYSLVPNSVCKNKNRFKAGKNVDLSGLCFIHINNQNNSPFNNGDYIVIGNASVEELRNFETVAKVTTNKNTIESNCSSSSTSCPPVWPAIAMSSVDPDETKASFPRGSSGSHFLIAENTHEIALLDDGSGNNKNIYWKKSAKIDATLFDGDRDIYNTDILLIENVSDLRFDLDLPKGILSIKMKIEKNGNTIDLYQEVNIRNVP